MTIVVTILKSPGSVSNSRFEHTFSGSGGTIGRGPGNTWVLDDPEKYMSTIHTQITHENGQYMLTDLSTNGTFINGSKEPVGNGHKVNLNDGDRFTISDYEFVVNIHMSEQKNDDLLGQPGNSNPFPDTNISTDPFSQNDPFASPVNQYVPPSDSTPGFDNIETDPLAALDKAGSHHTPHQDDQFSSNSFSDSGDARNDAIHWPDANIESGIIPDGWDDDDQPDHQSGSSNHTATLSGLSGNRPNDKSLHNFPDVEALSRAKNECLILENQNKELIAEVARLNRLVNKQNSDNQADNHQPKRDITLQDKTLIDSMGFSKRNLDDDKIMQISETTGLLVREMMEGMMQVLSFRKKIKEEFRINVTSIESVENNPLKFSANIDDAMENMFLKENNAYKEPIEAVREGFQGISEHQLAVLAGMQAAFRGMLERLDPATLEKQFEKYNKSGLLRKNRKHWESYQAYHAELTGNLDNSFQHLFGYDFVQAYEDQMQRLVASRKTK